MIAESSTGPREIESEREIERKKEKERESVQHVCLETYVPNKRQKRAQIQSKRLNQREYIYIYSLWA